MRPVVEMVRPLPWLSARQVAMLRAVAAGRAEVTCSRVPDLFVDGRCCTDHAASAALAAAGLVTAAVVGRLGERVPARLTAQAAAVLAVISARCGRVAQAPAASIPCDVPTRRIVPGGPSPGRVSNTRKRSGEDPMVATTNPDCLALGCDWDWWQEPCAGGHRHTVRVCARCLTADAPEPCPVTEPAESVESVESVELSAAASTGAAAQERVGAGRSRSPVADRGAAG